MWSTLPNIKSNTGHSPYRLLLSVGLPLLLLVCFLGSQFIDFDRMGLSSGFNHPLTGWDHLLTMLAVGIWAAQLRGHAIWMLPLSFVGVMSLGGMAGAAGIDIPSVEGIILLSCAVFSVLITRKIRFSGKLNVLIVAFFGFFHGYAHGHEISTSASLISYTLGFMLATLLLHGAGILVAKLVMFTITCLITLLFSSAALANTAQSRIDLNEKGTVQAQSCVTVNGGRDCLDNTDYRSSHSPITLSSVALDQKPVKHTLFDLLKSTATHAAEPAHLVLMQATDSPSSRLDFKHYYPDINQTPGKNLLSNGVGLTSPPACLHLSASAPVQAPRFKRLVFSTEDPLLHWLVASFNLGNLTSRLITDRSPDRASRITTTNSHADLSHGSPSNSLYPHRPIYSYKNQWPWSFRPGLVAIHNYKNPPEIAS